MWVVNGCDLKMTEGDWGLELPVTINDVTFSQNDEILFTLKDEMNGNTVLTKNFSDIVENTITLAFTEEESALLSVGTYYYALDWYQNGAFLCNIIPASTLKVVDKA